MPGFIKFQDDAPLMTMPSISTDLAKSKFSFSVQTFDELLAERMISLGASTNLLVPL